MGKKKWEEFVAPEDIDKLTNYLTGNIIKNQPAAEPYSFGFVDKKKRNHDVVITAGVIPRTQQFIFSFMEITGGERFEDSFGYNHQQMSGVIYNIPESTFAVDRRGRIIAWNRAIEELTGELGADLLLKGSYEYAIPFFKDRRPMIIDLIFASDTEIEDHGYTGIQWTGNTLSAETTVMIADGQAQVIREIASPIFNKAGKLAGAIESITDITGLREQELALRVSESRYRAILENTASAIAIIDEDGTISYINPEFEKIIGYVRDEIEGKKKLTEFVVPNDLTGYRSMSVNAGLTRTGQRQTMNSSLSASMDMSAPGSSPSPRFLIPKSWLYRFWILPIKPGKKMHSRGPIQN